MKGPTVIDRDIGAPFGIIQDVFSGLLEPRRPSEEKAIDEDGRIVSVGKPLPKVRGNVRITAADVDEAAQTATDEMRGLMEAPTATTVEEAEAVEAAREQGLDLEGVES